MAGRGGHRENAGRKVGARSRATIEAELLAARQQLAQYEDRQSKGHKLAIDVLNDVMHAAYGMMAKHQPLAPGEAAEAATQQGREPDTAKFQEWMRLTREAAGELAPFQSSKFKAVTLSIEQQPGATVPANPGTVRPLTGQEAYRMLRDSADLIELRPSASVTKLPVKKKQAKG